MLVVVDYKMINLGSILNMLKYVGAKDVVVSSSAHDVERASRIILPGVGSFDNAMTNLHRYDLVSVLKKKAVEDGTPFLGICLGMQLLTSGSEEGSQQGLGLIDAKTLKFRFGAESRMKIPHMGWNRIHVRRGSIALDLSQDNQRFYFVHSYYVKCDREENVMAETDYGGMFHSGIVNQNIIGVQFHPEKSHKHGIHFMRKFAIETVC